MGATRERGVIYIKFLTKKVFKAIPLWAVLLFVTATTALAAWLISQTFIRDNILGSQGTVEIEISADNAIWLSEMGAVFSNNKMALGEEVEEQWFFKSANTPAQVKMIVEDVVYSEGTNEQGAVIGAKIYDEMSLVKLDAGGAGGQLGQVTDLNANGKLDLGDLILAGESGITIDYSDQAAYQMRIRLDATAGDLDELNGDGVTFTFKFLPI